MSRVELFNCYNIDILISSCKKWVEFSENESLLKLYETDYTKLERKHICSEHFEDTKYNNPMKKIKLMVNALPTIKVNDKKRVTTVTFAEQSIYYYFKLYPTYVKLMSNLYQIYIY